jgi:hypothetical protein
VDDSEIWHLNQEWLLHHQPIMLVIFWKCWFSSERSPPPQMFDQFARSGLTPVLVASSIPFLFHSLWFFHPPGIIRSGFSNAGFRSCSTSVFSIWMLFRDQTSAIQISELKMLNFPNLAPCVNLSQGSWSIIETRLSFFRAVLTFESHFVPDRIPRIDRDRSSTGR